MDTLTHALIGSAIAETAFRKKLGRGSIIAGAVFAALPDADMLFSLTGDPLAMMKYHRAATHSLLLACIAAPLLGWLTWRIANKKGRILTWSLLALTAIFSHDLLDLCTTWGTEIFYPLTNKRYALDALPIIDPLITIPLLGAFFLMLLSSKLQLRKILAFIVLCWCVIYAGIGFYLSREAISLARTAVPAGFNIIREKAIPNTGTILLWHVVLKDSKGDFFSVFTSSLSGKVFAEKFYQSYSTPEIAKILNSEKLEVIRRSSNDLILASRENNHSMITFIDMRYAMLDQNMSSIPMFFFNVIIDRNNRNILRVERPMPDRHKSGSLQVYFDAIFN